MNRLLMMRTRGLSGPLMQNIGGGRLAKSTGNRAGKPFPEMADATIFEALIEDGVPGTIIATYQDDLEIASGFNKDAITVFINGVPVTTVGADVGLAGYDILEITFSPDAKAGDVVTYQYDCRVDPGFTDVTESLPINNALNSVTNGITA